MSANLYSRPIPAYPVAYSGTIVAGGWASGVGGAEITIPSLHQRAGDKQLNRVIEYLVTFVVGAGGSFAGTQQVQIYDDYNNPGVRIMLGAGLYPWRFVQSTDLRMAALNNNTDFFCMAYYEKPEE
jgi:hypothetical protein